MEILVMRMDAIGDVVHSLPALNALRSAYPKASITFLVTETASGIVLGHQAVDRVLVWPNRAASSLKTLHRWLSETIQLVGRRYDLIIDLHALFRSHGVIAYCSDHGKIGYRHATRTLTQRLLDTRIPFISTSEHAVDKCVRFLESIGMPAGPIDFNLPIAHQHRDHAGQLLVQHGVEDGELLILCSPITSWETKGWGRARYARLAEQLSSRHGVKVAFTGSQRERSEVQEIIDRTGGEAANLAGQTCLMTLAALCERADVLISGDSGPAHIAAAVGTPVVSIFGPTAPWRFRPYGSRHKVLWSGLECSPCFKHHYAECSTQACMVDITVDQVLSGVQMLLQRHV